MNTKRISIVLSILAALALSISACSPGAPEPINSNETVMVEKEVELEVAEGEEHLLSNTSPIDATNPLSGAGAPGRMIIKNGEIKLLVKDTDIAINRLTQIIADSGGYIINSRQWYDDYYGETYKYASYTIGVPVGQFERTLGHLREIAVRVLDEVASGQDVTDEYVDLNSQLENLQVTRDRIRTFLDQAKTVEEALTVNKQLSEVEAKMAQIQGRMNYLADRSSFSTITITLNPEIEERPVATPAPWDPGDTARDALSSLTTVLKGLADLGIWLSILVLPVLVAPLLAVAAVWRVRRRRQQAT